MDKFEVSRFPREVSWIRAKDKLEMIPVQDPCLDGCEDRASWRSSDILEVRFHGFESRKFHAWSRRSAHAPIKDRFTLRPRRDLERETFRSNRGKLVANVQVYPWILRGSEQPETTSGYPKVNSFSRFLLRTYSFSFVTFFLPTVAFANIPVAKGKKSRTNDRSLMFSKKHPRNLGVVSSWTKSK